MKAIEDLRKEHKAIELMLRVLEAVSARILRREPVAVTDLEAMGEFLSVFAATVITARKRNSFSPPWRPRAFRARAAPSV